MESELQEAMSENVLAEESLLDGKDEFFLYYFRSQLSFLSTVNLTLRIFLMGFLKY